MNHSVCQECGKPAEKCLYASVTSCPHWRRKQIQTGDHLTFRCTTTVEPANVECYYCGRVITTYNPMIIMTQTCMECHEAIGEVLSAITNKYKFKPYTPATLCGLSSDAERLFLEKRGYAVTCKIIGEELEAGCLRIQFLPSDEGE